jgi:hypothetical protein
MKPTRILLADDYTLTLQGIRAVLDPHHEIVGMVMDGRADILHFFTAGQWYLAVHPTLGAKGSHATSFTD